MERRAHFEGDVAEESIKSFSQSVRQIRRGLLRVMDLSMKSLMDLSPLARGLRLRKLCRAINTSKLWAALVSEKRSGDEQNLSGNYNERIGYRRRAT